MIQKTIIRCMLGAFLCMVGCGQPAIKHRQVENGTDSTVAFYLLDFEKIIKQNPPDTFVLNDIAQDIRWVPLQTTDSSLIGDIAFKLDEIDQSYIVSAGWFTKAQIKQFDTTGRFMRDLIQLGHGPKELPRFHNWVTNDSLQKISIIGPMKMIVRSFKNNNISDIFLHTFVGNCALLNDGHYVCAPTYGSNDAKEPYLYFLDSTGESVKSLFYPQNRELEVQIPEGAYTGPYESYGIYPNYTGDALFRDMFNDTIYRIRGVDDIRPYICINRGKLAPKIEDAHNVSRKDETIYIRHLSESQKYLFFKYAYKKNYYTMIWDKKSKKIIANTPISDISSFEINYKLFAKYRTPNGEEVMVNIVSLTADRMYGILRTSQAMKFVPGVTENSNPVILVIDLK